MVENDQDLGRCLQQVRQQDEAAAQALVQSLYPLVIRIARRQIEARNNPENWNIRVAREFDRIVHPTPEQEPRLQALLENAVGQLQSIRRQTIARSADVIGRLIADVEKESTPEQRQAFQSLKPKPADLNLDVLQVGPSP